MPSFNNEINFLKKGSPKQRGSMVQERLSRPKEKKPQRIETFTLHQCHPPPPRSSINIHLHCFLGLLLPTPFHN